MKYIFLSQDDKTPLYAMGAVLVILIWAWFYFHVSLKDVLSISSYDESIKTSKQEKCINEDKIQMLTQLKNLLDSGILTQEEFEKQKKEILNS